MKVVYNREVFVMEMSWICKKIVNQIEEVIIGADSGL